MMITVLCHETPCNLTERYLPVHGDEIFDSNTRVTAALKMLNLRGKNQWKLQQFKLQTLPAVAFLSLSSSLQIQAVLTTVLESAS